MKRPADILAIMAMFSMDNSMEIVNSYSTKGRSKRRYIPWRNPDPKNLDNNPDRAKGMKAFDIDGVIIYSGTLKAAIKKAKLLQHQQQP